MTEQDRHPEPTLDRRVEELLRTVEGEIPEPVVTLPRGPLDREERTIKDILLRMGSIIEERIRLTIESLETHDAEKALLVILGDEEINALQVQVMDEVVLTIATQAPVARDLRYLMTLDRVGYELERIGDSVANVAKRARELAPEAPLEGHVGVPEMGRLAREVSVRDDEIDAIYHRAVDRVTQLAKDDPGNVERAMRLLIAARYMERVGDHITNIAEDVVFLSSGQHEDLNP
jgi:phosphate transport system protein